MIQLIYVSTATRQMSEDDLVKLLTQSRERNGREGITGLLLHVNSNFLQILEGERKNVEGIYRSILNDDRNTSNILIDLKDIENRAFPDWRMGFQRIAPDELGPLEGYSDFLHNGRKLKLKSAESEHIIKLFESFKRQSQGG